MWSKLTFLFVCIVGLSNAGKIPSFLTACAPRDSKCALEAAQKGLEGLLAGYKPFKMRSIEPFKFDHFDLSTGDSLKLFLTKGELKNIKSLKFTEFDTDTENKKWTIKGRVSVVVDGEYEVNGRVLILPVNGKGKAHIELDDIDINYVINLDTEEKDGKTHLKIKSSDVEMTPHRMHVQFDNLFNGDKALGDQFNLFVNENWQDVEKEFHTGIIELMKTIVEVNVGAVFSHVPKDELVA